MIEFIECQKAGYPARTEENVVNSDVTLAFAVDFTSAGERLTKALCKRHNKLYVAFDLNNLNLDNDRVFKLATYIMRRGLHVIRLNVAGNGIYTLPQSQQYYNEWMFEFFNQYIGHSHNLFNTISVCSGGQTGIDTAGIIAAHKHGYNCIVRPPKGYLFRDGSHKDIRDEEAFKSRFL